MMIVTYIYYIFFIAGGTVGQPAGGDGDRPGPEEAKA
jgi:hypothetical protein